MKDEIADLYKQQQKNKYVYACLRNRKCSVCGKSNADFEHWKTASSLGGYKSDKGQGLYISLCRELHTEKHQIGVLEFNRKYGLKGIKLSEEQIKEIKKINPNHLKGFKEER